MAVTALLYGLVFQSAFNAEIDFDTDTMKAMLCTSTYAPNQDTHRYKSSVTNEVTGTGYTARGVTLTTKTVTYTAGTNTLALDADDPTWAASTITARYLVVYKDTGSDATSPLLCYVDFGADVSSTNATFTYQVPAAGLVTLAAA
jgi:hypothetical protein